MQSLENRFAFQMERHFKSVEKALEHVPAALWPYFLYPPEGQLYVPPLGDADGPAVSVRVNQGVWQTVCPFCPSAQHASITDRRFFCARCLNTAAGNRTVPVVWPDDNKLTAIETAMADRPFVTTQNWEADEPVEQLFAENEGVRAEPAFLALDEGDAGEPPAAPVVFDAAHPEASL